MYDRILVPIDGSDAAANAIPYALDAAKTYDAALYTLSVVNAGDADDGEKREAMYEEFETESKRTVEDLIDRAEEEGIRTTAGSIAEGKPHRAIRRYADEQGIDLIVMGTHGRGGIRYPLRRSVTEAVLRRADVPVLVIRLGNDES
ncbi:MULTISPECIES: universal stress protein [unclassified Haladaptatus]|uniref:universal stress protein n=1 Tax=unclassified Haladaptatus TaxID=2622732 RepID=UPI00209C5C93|nr:MULTISPECIES: universal stress protein [unclassified Haladaptatus]MCO8243048.1 universal stress protein [Haladaptatus sp. AB643]MCO8252762.1 universal stress protein [Haladaptatus sp. AB618]